MKIIIKNEYVHLRAQLELLNYRVDDNRAVCESHVATLPFKLNALKRLGINTVILEGLQDGSKVTIPEEKEAPRLTTEEKRAINRTEVLADRKKMKVTEADFQDAGWIKEIKKILNINRS